MEMGKKVHGPSPMAALAAQCCPRFHDTG
jgi:hypothetical protein